MRALILIASLSVLVLTGCVHTHHGHWRYDDRPGYSKKQNHNRSYNRYKRPQAKHHHQAKKRHERARRDHNKRKRRGRD